jgi:hypothetical protein
MNAKSILKLIILVGFSRVRFVCVPAVQRRSHLNHNTLQKSNPETPPLDRERATIQRTAINNQLPSTITRAPIGQHANADGPETQISHTTATTTAART